MFKHYRPSKGRLDDSPRARPPSCHCQHWSGNRPQFTLTHILVGLVGLVGLIWVWGFILLSVFLKTVLYCIYFSRGCVYHPTTWSGILFMSIYPIGPHSFKLLRVTLQRGHPNISKHHGVHFINKDAVGGHDDASPRAHTRVRALFLNGFPSSSAVDSQQLS